MRVRVHKKGLLDLLLYFERTFNAAVSRFSTLASGAFIIVKRTILIFEYSIDSIIIRELVNTCFLF